MRTFSWNLRNTVRAIALECVAMKRETRGYDDEDAIIRRRRRLSRNHYRTVAFSCLRLHCPLLCKIGLHCRISGQCSSHVKLRG